MIDRSTNDTLDKNSFPIKAGCESHHVMAPVLNKHKYKYK